jgi:glycosyltransferase involved in cell wall biosynthesis
MNQALLKISFCTVSMNRLHHLRLTLPKNIKDNIGYNNIEFIVIDYNSTDGLQDWILNEMQDYLEQGILKFYRTEEPVYFNRSHSRNMAFNKALGDIICNIDADNYTGPLFANYVSDVFSLNKDCFVTAEYCVRDSMGRLCVSAKDYHRIRGYNEALEGYGYDDVDIYKRLELNLRHIYINNREFLVVINHAHRDRYKNEYMGINISQIFIGYLKPYLSELIFLFKNGQYDRGRILDNELIADKNERQTENENIVTLLGDWEKGLWPIGGEVNDYHTDSKFELDNITFYKVDDHSLFDEILLLRTEIDNRLKHVMLEKTDVSVNVNGYGLGLLKSVSNY